MKRVLLICALFLAPSFLYLTPCHAQPRRIDPFSADVGQFIKVGEMNDSTLTGGVHPVGDCDNNNLNDWILHRQRRDTVIDHFGNPKLPLEVFLYKGVQGGRPSIENGKRIGLTEVGVLHQFLATGDWDNDGNLDVAMRTYMLNDSSYGTRGTNQYDLVVFWGNAKGEYSVADTSRLMCAADAWASLCKGVSGDLDLDEIDDLIIHSCGYHGSLGVFKGGTTTSIPSLHIFKGHDRQRWSRNGLSHRADWEWWQQPIFTRLGDKLIDQNCDDAPDIALYHDAHGGGHISILYGNPGGGLPDTNNVETVDLSSPWPPAETSQLFDVTGDQVLDMVVLDDLGSTDSQRIRVYPGEPGVRLTAMYGTGLNPWANYPTPIMLHDGWGGYLHRLYDLGSANPMYLPGNRDIYAYHHPFLVSYTTGIVLDSLIDGYYRFDGLAPQTFVDLGDIDGSDLSTIAVGYTSLGFGSGVIYLKGSDSIVGYGTGRPLPHPREVRCWSTVSIASDEWRATSALGLRVIPNPSSGTVRIAWRLTSAEETIIAIHDVLGQEVVSFNVPAYEKEAVWEASATFGGTYYITATMNDATETIGVLIR